MVLGDHIYRQTLRDRCYLDTRTSGEGWGTDRAAIAYTDGTDLLPCRVVAHAAKEIPDNDSKAKVATVAVFLESGTQLNESDRLRIVKRHGQAVTTGVVYGVIRVEYKGYGVMAECNEAKGASIK